MFNLRKILAAAFLPVIFFSALAADASFNNEEMTPLNDDFLSKFHKHSPEFKLKDLEGTYIIQGITAGGPNTQGSATVGTFIFDKDGNGIQPFITVRSFSGTLPPTTFHVPSAQTPSPLRLKIELNSDGTGRLHIFGFPTAADITHFDIVLKKENGKVTKGFFVKTGVTGPSASSDAANEIKLFQMERQ